MIEKMKERLQIKSLHSEYQEYRTELQWAKKKKLVIKGKTGKKMWSNRHCSVPYYYFSPDEVYDASKEELKTYFEMKREREEKLEEQRRREEEIKRREFQKYVKAIEREREEMQRFVELEKILYYKEKTIEYWRNLKEEKEYITPECICLEIETTGRSFQDEILQISIIDFDGNVILNEYLKPIIIETWTDAQCLHGISPETVKNCRYTAAIIPQLKAIIENAKMIIGKDLNTYFYFIRLLIGDDAFVKNPSLIEIDIRSKLGEVPVHDSLARAKDTLFCYQKEQNHELDD